MYEFRSPCADICTSCPLLKGREIGVWRCIWVFKSRILDL